MKYGDEEYKAMMNKPFTDNTMCEFVGGILDGQKMTVKELRERGLESGKTADRSVERKNGGICQYPIFDNSPKVSGYIGPMAGYANAPLRYETQSVFASSTI